MKLDAQLVGCVQLLGCWGSTGFILYASQNPGEALFVEIVSGAISVCWRVEDGCGGRTPDCVTTEGVWIAGLAEKVM